MTRHEIAKLACRILAVWLFCQTVVQLYGVVLFMLFGIRELFSDRANWTFLAGSAGVGLAGLGYAVIGIILWWQSGRIAGRMVSSDPAPVTAANLDQNGAMSIAFCAVGVLLAGQAIPEMTRPVYAMVREYLDYQQVFSINYFEIKFWTNVGQLALALWLIFGACGLANLVRRMRTLGVADAADPQPPHEGNAAD
jgi:hypothetical protein